MDNELILTRGQQLVDQHVQSTIKAVTPGNTKADRSRMAANRLNLEKYIERLEIQTGNRKPISVGGSRPRGLDSKGYYVQKRGNKHQVSLTSALGRKYLGTYDTPEEADRVGAKEVAKIRGTT